MINLPAFQKGASDFFEKPCQRCGEVFLQCRVSGRRRLFHPECAVLERKEKRILADQERRERYAELKLQGASPGLAQLGSQGARIFRATSEVLAEEAP